VVVALGRPILGLFGPDYRPAYPVLVLLAVTNALASVGYLGSTLLLADHRVRLLVVLSAVSYGVSVGGGWLVAGRGLTAVSLALLAGETILAAGYLRLTARAAVALDAVRDQALLVVAPHPDDETFGCGGLIARARAAGCPVTVVVVTDGSRSTESERLSRADLVDLRRAELRAACDRLGVTDVVEWGYPDGDLPPPPVLADRLAALLADRRPGVVLTPCVQDPHPDHVAVHRATVRAAGDVPIVLGYPVWTWHAGPFFLGARTADLPRLHAWAVRQLWSGRWWRIPVGRYGEAKRDAVRAYRSQIGNLTGEPGWSYLPPEFVELFLGADEMFLVLGGVRAGRAR
jgi:LmbE family N-acetylglucosaminyl deacetylase